jgi:uncharacterized membrane protein YoaK (UPF0700 family)
MPQNTRDTLRTAWILFATAFAAGAVDIIGFTKLGGVFASAMTGNFALLAYHVAKGNTLSAIGSVIALLGFVSGCLIGFSLRRGRTDRATVSLLLGTETILLLVFALMPLAGRLFAVTHWQVAVLAVAMGLQAVVGQIISLSTIVFTTTLTRLIGGIADAIATRNSTGLRDIREQVGLISSYLLGALLAGVLIVNGFSAVVFLPLAGVGVALLAHRFGGVPGANNP